MVIEAYARAHTVNKMTFRVAFVSWNVVAAYVRRFGNGHTETCVCVSSRGVKSGDKCRKHWCELINNRTRHAEPSQALNWLPEYTDRKRPLNLKVNCNMSATLNCSTRNSAENPIRNYLELTPNEDRKKNRKIISISLTARAREIEFSASIPTDYNQSTPTHDSCNYQSDHSWRRQSPPPLDRRTQTCSEYGTHRDTNMDVAR